MLWKCWRLDLEGPCPSRQKLNTGQGSNSKQLVTLWLLEKLAHSGGRAGIRRLAFMHISGSGHIAEKKRKMQDSRKV